MTTSTDRQTTYPLPPAPAWAAETIQDGDRIYHLLDFGRVRVVRSDWLTVDGVNVGDVEIRTNLDEDEEMTVGEARAVALQFAHAADTVDQG